MNNIENKVNEQLKIIMKGIDEIIGLEELKIKLKNSIINNKPLVVKLGLDPSAPDIHLGHTVVLRKMKQLQDLGHKVVIIIGDFTGKIGDPTGKAKGRKALSSEQVLENARTYESQIFKVLDKEKTEVRFNSEWLSTLSFEETIRLASTMTVARMLEREDFKKRYENHVPISIHEFFYPLMQGFDSVQIHADIELGGTDQRFNVLMGRMLQKEYNMEMQATIFMPLLEGIDGKDKMSKSLGNYIGIDESPEVMFEKSMRIPDNLIIKYFNLVTDVHPDKVAVMEEKLNNGENPRNIKLQLAKEITLLYSNEEKAEKAEDRFRKVFQNGEIPQDIDIVEISDGKKIDIAEIIVSNNLLQSKNEFRRLVSQGGFKFNNKKITNLNDLQFEKNNIIQVGKKKFLRLDIK